MLWENIFNKMLSIKGWRNVKQEIFYFNMKLYQIKVGESYSGQGFFNFDESEYM